MSDTPDSTTRGSIYTCYADYRQRLYCSQYPATESVQTITEYTLDSANEIPLSLQHEELLIPPFRIVRWGQHFINPRLLRIDTRELSSDRYRIVAAHNFHVDDRNPVLHECLTGIFLSRKIGYRWQQAEDRPCECRSIAILGILDRPGSRILAP